jgi:hypothetical protein
LISADDAWGFALFADDLRDEVGGKQSVMGLYQHDLILTAPSLPVMLPKLVILIMYYEKAGAISSDLRFRIEIPEFSEGQSPVSDIPVRRIDLPNPSLGKSDDESEAIFHFRIPVIASPFPVLATGPIKVRCHYDDGQVLRLGRLNLIHRPEKKSQD